MEAIQSSATPSGGGRSRRMMATRLNTQLLLQRSAHFNQNLSAEFLILNSRTPPLVVRMFPASCRGVKHCTPSCPGVRRPAAVIPGEVADALSFLIASAMMVGPRSEESLLFLVFFATCRFLPKKNWRSKLS